MLIQASIISGDPDARNDEGLFERCFQVFTKLFSISGCSRLFHVTDYDDDDGK